MRQFDVFAPTFGADLAGLIDDEAAYANRHFGAFEMASQLGGGR